MGFPLEKGLVNRTEGKLGRKLPAGYVARMCLNNGGEIETATDSWNLYPILDDSDRSRLKRTCNDIVRETESAREWARFPAGVLAIGENGSGDYLVFLAERESDRFGDAVYWWDHETGELNPLANTFEELT